MEYAAAVFIGRFQPFHNGHLEVLRHGLKIAEKVIVLVGSSDSARNIKNPFSFEERSEMVFLSLKEEELSRVKIEPIRDYHYSDAYWCAQVQSTVLKHSDSARTCLIGSMKDDSSYYLRLFPQWPLEQAKIASPINATDIREAMFSGIEYNEHLPNGTKQAFFSAVNWRELEGLKDEYAFIKRYKNAWAYSPHDPIFVTTDAVVVQSGHVIVVKRKSHPGKGLFALPGGFLKASERIEDGALRELREETNIKIPINDLRKSIVEHRVFDYPGRSLRGRTITHAILIELEGGLLPEIRGEDDAESAFWMPISQVYARTDLFYEDHFSIIDSLLMKGRK